MTTNDIVDLKEYDALRQTGKNTGLTDIAAGDIVIVDVSDLTQRCIKHTTTADDPLVKGIAVEAIAKTKEGIIALKGRANANVKTGVTAVAVGSKLGTSATAGKLDLATANPIAIALEAVAASTTKTIVVEIL